LLYISSEDWYSVLRKEVMNVYRTCMGEQRQPWWQHIPDMRLKKKFFKFGEILQMVWNFYANDQAQ